MSKREISKNILKRFPDIKLSYNKNINRKVYADYYLIVPKGQKAMLWYTYQYKKNVCLLLRLDFKGNIRTIEQYSGCFDSTLAYGTIFYGSILEKSKNIHQTIFCIEDIYYYKGKNVERKYPIEKLKLYKQIFQSDISQKSYGTQFIVPVLAYMSTDYNDVKKTAGLLNYQVYGIKYIKKTQTLGVEKYKNDITSIGLFYVSASIQDDIYNIFCVDSERKSKRFVGIAMISSYKKSVFMNKLFRNIKENDNLDLLEESDDDEEFEDISSTKFVDLEKELIMKCVYNRKFKKWEPIEEINSDRITTQREVQNLEK